MKIFVKDKDALNYTAYYSNLFILIIESFLMHVLSRPQYYPYQVCHFLIIQLCIALHITFPFYTVLRFFFAFLLSMI